MIIINHSLSIYYVLGNVVSSFYIYTNPLKYV